MQKRLLFFIFISFQLLTIGFAQQLNHDTVNSLQHADTLHSVVADTPKTKIVAGSTIKKEPLQNTVVHVVNYSKENDILFYVITGLFLFLGILKAAFPKYFGNMIRVFFNTSLRQMQLTDQLLQSQLASMLFNVFFVLVGGTFLYLILSRWYDPGMSSYLFLPLSVASVLTLYLTKFIVIRFTGWITGYRQDAAIYTFLVFLVNKVVALFLLPFMALIAFTKEPLQSWSVNASLIIAGLFLLIRYVRSFGLLREKHGISPFHFLVYAITVEILPILLICHFTVQFLGKKM